MADVDVNVDVSLSIIFHHVFLYFVNYVLFIAYHKPLTAVP